MAKKTTKKSATAATWPPETAAVTKPAKKTATTKKTAAKKTAAAGFVMASAIRDVLADPATHTLTAPEILAEVQKRHPQVKINAKSAGVAVSNAKKKLGLVAKKSVKKTVAKPANAPKAAKRPAGGVALTVADLEAASELVQSCGSVASARAALEQLAALTGGVR